MIKTIMLASFFMAFTFIAIPTTSALAHCGKCGVEKSHTTKPCEKKLDKKMPCEKCSESMKKSGKPCMKCMEAEKKFQDSKAKSSKGYHNHKGSLTFKSGESLRTGGTGSYNN